MRDYSIQLANLVRFVHHLVMAYIILPPFLTTNDKFLTVHLFLIIAVMIHWATNNNKCCLTQLEGKLRQKVDESFVGSKWNLSDQTTWAILVFLLFVTLYKLNQTGFIYLKQIFKAHP